MQTSGWVIFLQFILAGYLLSLGFALIFGQKNGAQRVNRFWMKLGRGVFRKTLKIIGDFFRWAAKQV